MSFRSTVGFGWRAFRCRYSAFPRLLITQPLILSDDLPLLLSYNPPTFLPTHLLIKMRLSNMTDALGSLSLPNPHRVLVVGCAYGGISAVINLLEYVQGRSRQSVYPGPDFKGTKTTRGVEITVIDERDGYCASPTPQLAKFSYF